MLRISAGFVFGAGAILNFFTTETFTGETLLLTFLSAAFLIGPQFLSLCFRVKQNMDVRIDTCACSDTRIGLSCSKQAQYAVSLIALDPNNSSNDVMSYTVCEEHHPHIGRSDSRCARWWSDITEKKGLTIHVIEILN
ncbi:MAG: hypothetical protein HYT93_05215 [Parcubacteria group bacterium]|nr:hypothetical protein [Parcubacteria group bacterium]